ncbi:MAG: dethiobiotin synthase [Campylobacterales bacterium]|nr:dethiobiotin synthase [Campylobacterales bacterium]
MQVQLFSIFVTATGTDVGKTFVTLKLIKELSKKGYKVGALKPIETGVKNLPIDGIKLYKQLKKYNPKLYKKISLKDIVPITMKLPAAPYVANKGKINYKIIDEAYKKLKKHCDIVLIEGAGGAFVPIDKKNDMTYFIERYKIDKTILVTRDSLGTISDTITYVEQLTTKNIRPIVHVNIRNKKEYKEKSHPYFKKRFKNLTLNIKGLTSCIKES